MKVFISLLVCLLCCVSSAAQPKPSHPSLQKPEELNAFAVELWQRGQYDSALVFAEKSQTLSLETRDSLTLAKSMNTFGMIYNSKGDPAKSIYYYEQALAILKALDNKDLIPSTMTNIGIVFMKQAVYDKALSNLFEAAIYFEEKKELRSLSSVYNSIGSIYRYERSYDKALQYHALALEARKELRYDKGIAGSLNNIGTVYTELGNYDSALYYFNLSLKLKEIGNLPYEKASTLSNIAETHFLKKNYTLAETYFIEVHKLLEEAGDKVGLSESYYNLARINIVKSAYPLAEKQALLSIKIATEAGVSDIRLKAYTLLKKIYTSTKNYPKALVYADLFIGLNDTLLGEEKQKSITQLEIKYEMEKKQRELQELNREKEKAEAILLIKDMQLASKTTYTNSLIITLVLLSAVIILLLLLFRDRNAFAKKLDLVIRELHHRVKNNFQVLLSLFNLQLANVQDETTKALIGANRNRITAMMLIHSGLYFDKDSTRVKIGNYIQNLVDNLLLIYELSPERIHIHYDIDKNLDIDVDKSIPLGLLINELVTNALKYAFDAGNPAPALHIYFHKNAGQYCLRIEDNGPGFDQSLSKKSFGLKLAESQAKQLKGTLKTTQNNGLHYEIIFP